MEHTQRALHKRHGYLVRIAPDEISCSDPAAIKTIYGPNSGYTKTDFYDAWAPPLKGYTALFAIRDEKLHAERRRIVNHVYSMTSVLESESAVDSCTHLFCGVMRDFSRRNVVVDLGLWINRYAFDVLGELFYGQKFGFITEGKDIGNCSEMIDSMIHASTMAGTLPSYLTKVYFLCSALFVPSFGGNLGAAIKLVNVARAAVERSTKDIQASREDQRPNMLRKLLGISAAEATTALFAGADTTSTAILSILYHLLHHPVAYAKLTARIDAGVEDGTLSMPVSYADAIKRPYLRACINEGMRLHPSVGLTLPRHVPVGGATIASIYLPSGYRVDINAAVVQYDQQIFGRDADQFNPDRWIEGDAIRMERTMFQFGAGSRTCIGKNISLSEIHKLILNSSGASISAWRIQVRNGRRGTIGSTSQAEYTCTWSNGKIIQSD